MDFDLGFGRKTDTNSDDEVQVLTRRNALLKEQIEAVRERIDGLKKVSGKEDFLSIPTSFVSNPAPIIIVSTDLQLREANESFAQLSGLGEDTLIFGSDALLLFAPDFRQKVGAALKKLSEAGKVDPFEAELSCGDGSYRPVMIAPTKMGPTNNDCFIFFFDMAQRKAMQKELDIRQSNLSALAEAIPSLIWVSSADGLVTYANEQFRTYTGLALDSGQVNWRELLPSEDRKNFAGTTFSLGQVYADFQTEVRLRREDGSFLWHLLKVVPFFSSGGVSMNWLVIATEIDDQKKLSDSLMVAEEQLRVIADAMPQIVWTADAYGVVDFLNDRWFEYTGLTGEQSLHGGWRLLMHSEDLPKYEEAWRKAVKVGEAFEVEFRLKRVLGLGSKKNSQSLYRPKTSSTKVEPRDPRRDYLWHLCRAVPLKTPQGLVVRWFGTWTEIDEHKARN
ncbi:MAG: PAS domain-containing protein [Cyanobacteria bacterium SZAS LIN-3]|nr:PAS domain-containing protein [Cyanobacteria bacterium SZAS LIN-3]MBS2005635.1 PAS domain-containing protein [Cyanobacteria bacterium SZAS TMP-1]